MKLAWKTHSLADGAFRWPMSMSPCWCAQATDVAGRPWLMLPIIGRHNFPKERRTWLMLSDVGWCKCHSVNVQTPRPMREYLGLYCIPLDNVAFYMHTCYVICMHAWLMVPANSRRRLPKAHKSWLMVPPIGRRWYSSADTHTPQVKHPYLGWCNVKLSDVASLDSHKKHQMQEDLGWCCLPFADIAWLMHLGLDWCCPIIVYMPRQMCAVLSWRSLSLVDVAWAMRRK